MSLRLGVWRARALASRARGGYRGLGAGRAAGGCPRLFCSGGGPGGAQAEVAEPAVGSSGARAAAGPQPTGRQLYEAAVAAAPNRGQQSMQAVGGTLVAGGLGVLAWHNWAAVAALATWNALGGGLVFVGSAVAAASASGSRRAKKSEKPQPKFKLTLLNDVERWKADQKQLAELLGQKAWPSSSLEKAAKEQQKEWQRKVKDALADKERTIKEALDAGHAPSDVLAQLRPRTFVFDFQVSPPQQDGNLGSIRQKLVDLRDTVTFVLACASPHDSVVLRLKSPGGGVTDYGLAASQLLRFRKAEVPLTVCIDNVAASGGYMMASTANTIVAAPFAFVGSIGVIAMLPNFHKLLRRVDVDFFQFTAGKWKRTIDPFTEPTEAGMDKMREDVVKIHEAFKGHVAETRDVDIEGVATGEVFMGVEAQSRGLVDQLATSDEFLASQMQRSDVVEVSLAPPKKKGLLQMLEGRLQAAEAAVGRLLGRLGLQSCEGHISLESADPKIRGG